MFVYELSGCGFESSCSHFTFRYLVENFSSKCRYLINEKNPVKSDQFFSGDQYFSPTNNFTRLKLTPTKTFYQLFFLLNKNQITEIFINGKMSARHGCSPENLLHIFRTSFPKNTSEGLFL